MLITCGTSPAVYVVFHAHRESPTFCGAFLFFICILKNFVYICNVVRQIENLSAFFRGLKAEQHTRERAYFLGFSYAYS